MNCLICRGAHPDWEVVAEGRTRHACKDHVSKVLSDIGRGIFIIVRGIG
jgi:hypothetical protein